METPLTALDPVRERTATDLVNWSPTRPVSPLRADKWILSSAFQKAVRRGDVETAQAAAMALLDTDKQMLFRRLHVLAVEDLGIGDVDLASVVFAIAGYDKTRRHLGGDHFVVAYLIERMCGAAMDRTADHLLSIAENHPDLRSLRWQLGQVSMMELLALIRNREQPMAARALAVWYASGTRKFASDNLHRREGDLGVVFEVFQDMGVDGALLQACLMATKKMRNPLPLFVPLIWSEWFRSQSGGIEENELPSAAQVRGIPTYALGGHTRLGKRALRQFLKSCDPIQNFLTPLIARSGWQDTTNVGLFHVESALVHRQRLWDGMAEIRQLGTEGDLCRNGLPPEAVNDFLAVVRENLPLLDDIRIGLLEAIGDQPSGNHPSVTGA